MHKLLTKIASLNMDGLTDTHQDPGMKQVGKRDEVERYMIKNNIEILMLQEPKTNQNTMEKRKTHTWYITGEPQCDAYPHGVACVIKNDLKKYIHAVIPINDRLMVLQMRLTKSILLTIINVYAPHSGRTDEEKASLYSLLTKTYKKYRNKGPTLIVGDFNAKPSKPTKDDCSITGNFALFPNLDTMLEIGRESEGAIENRRLLQSFCTMHELQIINTFFDKPKEKLFTNRKFGIHLNKEIQPTTHSQIDHCLLEKRWRRGIRNVEANPHVNMVTWHSALEIELQFILKANYFKKPKKE
jgi:exonuclease III